MKTRLLTALLAAAIGAASPDRAAAGQYAGALGLRYDRLETWTPLDHTVSPLLQLDGNLSAAGSVYAPDVLVWNGALSYSQVRQSYLSDDRTNGLSYLLSLRFFETRLSRATLSATASRSIVDHTFSDAGVRATGTTIGQYTGVQSSLNLPQRPSLRVGVSRNEETNSGLGRAPTTTTIDQLSAGIRHGPGPYTLDAQYDGSWHDGTLPSSDFVQHGVSFRGAATAAQRVDVFADEQYQQRIAKTVDEFNPSSDSSSFSGGVRWAGETSLSRASAMYAYGHALLQAPGIETREQLSHGVQAQADRTFSPAWSGTASASVNLAQSRLGDAQETNAGQSVGATATWQRRVGAESLVLVQAGPSVGLLEPQGGSVELAYGGQARVRWSKDLPLRRYSVEYSADYRSNLEAVRGWLLSQRVRADASATWVSGLRAGGYVYAEGSRQHQDLLGDTMGRSVQAAGQMSWRRYTAELSAGLSTVPTLYSGGTVSDGLFIPTKFATTSRSVAASLSAGITPRLGVNATTRYAVISGGGVPSQQEAGVSGMLKYGFGLIDLTLEDRYTAGGASSFDIRTNAFFVRLSRTFGGRF